MVSDVIDLFESKFLVMIATENIKSSSPSII
jgi:hypothetical protein